MLVVATCFWDQKDPSRISSIVDFVKNADFAAAGQTPLANVLVAVNDKADVTNALEVVNDLRLSGLAEVEAFDVRPWGFVRPLTLCFIKPRSWVQNIFFLPPRK